MSAAPPVGAEVMAAACPLPRCGTCMQFCGRAPILDPVRGQQVRLGECGRHGRLTDATASCRDHAPRA